MKKGLLILSSALMVTSSTYAVSLRDSVEMSLSNNPNVIAERKNQEAYRKYVDEREGTYLPTIDLEAYVSDESINEDRDNVSGDGEWIDKDGYNAAIIFRQYLYDGGLTPAQVAETKFQNVANKYRSLYSIENTILETVRTYNSLVELDERLALSADMIKTHEENLIIAKEKEQISGEVLETYQVASKLHFVTDRYIEEQDLKDSAIAEFKRYVGSEPKGSVCRPEIDETQVPKTLKEAIEVAVLRNYRVLEQIERIKLQREKIAQSNANFLPSLNLELKASYDKDLELTDGTTKERYARLNFSWNLFNGNRDKVRSEQEEIFLQEEKKKLDDITNEVVSEVKSLYGKHFRYKDRVKAFMKYVEANVNIVEVYKNEFEAGTRTFVDILNAESELYESSKNLIQLEQSAINNYYSLMFNLSKLSDIVLITSNQDCANVKPRKIEYIPEKKNKESNNNELDGLISQNDSAIISKELGLDTNLDEQKELLLDTEVSNTASSDAMKLATNEYKSFLDAPQNYYTINVATKNGLTQATDFINENNLGDNAFSFEFGRDNKKAKVLYGVYSSVKEAKEALKLFNENVLSNKPYIDNIKKHQALYSKYN